MLYPINITILIRISLYLHLHNNRKITNFKIKLKNGHQTKNTQNIGIQKRKSKIMKYTNNNKHSDVEGP